MITITDNKGLMKIKGQHSVCIEPKQGICRMHIRILSGELRINHCCYSPDGGSWLESPGGKRQAHHDVSSGGVRELIFDIRESFGRKDKLMIVNPHFLKICEFEYEIM